MRLSSVRALALVELLIAGALVALLAVIIVPNLDHARFRSDVAQVHTDFTAIATAQLYK